MARDITVTFADNTQHVYQNAPDDITPDQVEARASKEFGKQVAHLDGGRGKTQQPAQSNALTEAFNKAKEAKQSGTNILGGLVHGAADIGATLLSPIDAAAKYAAKKLGVEDIGMLVPEDRRAAIEQGLKDLGYNPNAIESKFGRVASNIAGTAGAGGLVARGAAALPAELGIAPKLAAAIESGGFSTGAAPAARLLSTEAAKNAATRLAGGAIAGGASAGLVNPEDVTSGAAIGAAIPVAGKVIGSAIPSATPDVAKLYQKAKDLGIDIPADRLINNRALNAAAASLEYMPFSGRAATETVMNNQIKQKLSQTFGEDTPHITKDLISNAKQKLGQQFDNTLKNNVVNVDTTLQNDLLNNLDVAQRELSSDNFKIIDKQINEILAKGASGQIEGQAAYNIKKTLDRLANGNGNEAYHAKQVRESLMNALNRSFKTQDEVAAFSDLRRKYTNMKSLERLASNNVEGDISMARLGNIDSRNQEVKDLSQIAATFAKGRESPHGAAQRVVMGAGTAALGGSAAAGFAAPVAVGLTAGRIANTALNSNAIKRLMTDEALRKSLSENALARAALYNQANE